MKMFFSFKKILFRRKIYYYNNYIEIIQSLLLLMVKYFQSLWKKTFSH